MKTIFFLLSILFATSFAQAQDGPISRKAGYIVTNEGDRREGYFEIRADEDQLWLFQEKVVFITKEALLKKKLRRRDKIKLKPGDIAGYGLFDKYFESVKIADSKSITAVPKMRFCERMIDGVIKVYKFYLEPKSEETSKAIVEEYHVKIWREGAKAAYNVEEVDIMDYIGDCETVVERYRTGGYGFVPEEKKSVIGKLLTKKKNVVDMKVHIFNIASDYNSEMKQ